MKALLLVPMLLFAVFFTGCSKDGDVVIPNRTILTTVRSGDWKLNPDNDNKSYSVTLDMPEIDGNVNQTHGILVSVSADGTGFEAIPDVYNGFAFSYTHQPGSLTIETQSVEGTAGAPPGGDITVKIVIVVSQE